MRSRKFSNRSDQAVWRARLFPLVVTAATIALQAAPDVVSTTAEIETATKRSLVDVGGRNLAMHSVGTGAPCIVIEAGLGEAVFETGRWSVVVAELAKTNRVVIYERAGLGSSDAVTEKTRTTADLVLDLHRLLESADIRGPYVLVGHSIGGFVVRVFADRYPEEVAGLVLVDSAHPQQWNRWLEVLENERSSSKDTHMDSKSLLTNQFRNPSSNRECLDLAASSAEVERTRGLGETPLVVISHAAHWRMEPRLSEDASFAVQKVFEELQHDLTSLSRNSRRVTASRAGHQIQWDEPELVIQAVREVCTAARSGSRIQAGR